MKASRDTVSVKMNAFILIAYVESNFNYSPEQTVQACHMTCYTK